MKNLSLLLLLLAALVAESQYYYNDILSTRETNRQMQVFTARNVIRITATGYDASGVKATDFSEVQDLQDKGRTLKVSTRNGNNYSAVYNRFDEQLRLISIADTTAGVQSQTTYEYDDAGRIYRITNTVKDSANIINETEVHAWNYRPDGTPAGMWRTINGSDSLEIRLIPDEDGNPGDERTYRRGVENAVLYYYYDDKKRLTDIVRYNDKFKKLLPDIMFEYDDSDRVIQKITTTSNRITGYLIWRYIFDDKGLKTKEALFDNNKQITGKIEYEYLFAH